MKNKIEINLSDVVSVLDFLDDHRYDDAVKFIQNQYHVSLEEAVEIMDECFVSHNSQKSV